MIRRTLLQVSPVGILLNFCAKNPEVLHECELIETAVIEIAGMEFSILAAGPLFKFNEAVSFVINTKDQAETDYYWEALTA